MKYLIVKALITGMLLTNAGQVLASGDEYGSCIRAESWIDNDQCYGKYTNSGNGPKCHRVRFTPKLVQFNGLSIFQEIYSAEPVTLERNQWFTFHVRYRGMGGCSARVEGAGPG